MRTTTDITTMRRYLIGEPFNNAVNSVALLWP